MGKSTRVFIKLFGDYISRVQTRQSSTEIGSIRIYSRALKLSSTLKTLNLNFFQNNYSLIDTLLEKQLLGILEEKKL